jgi:hypothetical protein
MAPSQKQQQAQETTPADHRRSKSPRLRFTEWFPALALGTSLATGFQLWGRSSDVVRWLAFLGAGVLFVASVFVWITQKNGFVGIALGIGLLWVFYGPAVAEILSDIYNVPTRYWAAFIPMLSLMATTVCLLAGALRANGWR